MVLLAIFVVYAIGLTLLLGRSGVQSGEPAPEAAPGPEPRKVLIVGATGGSGRQLVSQALERGYEVTAFVRTPSRLQQQDPRLRVVVGDVLDYASVDAAVRGQDAVVSALGHKQFFRPTRILSDGTRNVLRAMEAHGVRRFVGETALSLGNSAGRLGLLYTFFNTPVILPFYFWDKTRQERAIAASAVDWIIVRPGALTNGARTGKYRHGRNVGSFVATVTISRADVAEFMLNQLTDNTYLKRAVGIAW
jgi:putative NADH-flavin reductase